MRFERNVSSAIAGAFAGPFQRQGFRVLNLIVNVKTFADDLSVIVDNYGAHERTGTDLTDALRG